MTGAAVWVRSIAGAALVCAAASVLTPKGKVKEITKLLCGVILLLVVIQPLTKTDSAQFSLDMAEYRDKAALIAGDAEKTSDALDRRFIERKLNAYILDKAKDLGLSNVTAAVTVRWGEGCWYPYEARLSGNATAREKELLENAIEYELGIPKERQYWDGNENKP